MSVASTVAGNLLLLGGTGFVGQAIASEAVTRGWRVVNVSRHASNLTDNGAVVNVRGNALDRKTYRELLDKYKIDAVVHSVGVLIEGSSTAEDIRTYEAVNRDTAITAAEECAGKVKKFAFISAAEIPGAGFVLQRYYKAKRDAEENLRKHAENGHFQAIIARPGFMYGSGRFVTYGITAMYNLMTFLAGSFFPASLSVDRVAHTLMDAVENDRDTERVRVLEVDDMK